VALGYVFKDYDYTARRYKEASQIGFLHDIPKKAVMEYSAGSVMIESETAFINYRGGINTYPTIEITNVLNRSYPPNFFKDKIVLIGSNSMEKHFVKTPLGFLTRTEYNANVIDNILNDTWIKFLDRKLYYLYLLLVTLLCFFILYLFTQSLAIYFLILTAVSLISISIFSFDVYNLWIPILSPLSILALSYVILLNFLLSRSEYLAWKSRKKEESILEMNELKNNFVSLFSHDLKTPLAKIHAISDTAMKLSGNNSDLTQENFLKIKKEAQELDRYIQSILQVTRIEAGEFNLNIAPHDINELINECIELLQPLASIKSIEIKFEEEPLFPVEIDVKLIKEVILNLLDNAVKYCPEGSTIVVETSDEGEHFFIKIEDNGPGIAEKEQETIFEKFYQPENVETNKKGTGLGLYLVRYFVEIHHGRVDLQSKLGQGTSFTITLPYTQLQEDK
jgi:signal transduction histidine kinase